MEDVRNGLQALRTEIIERGIESIAIPPLGSGLGGLDWPIVKAAIEEALGDMDIPVTVFEPNAAPDAKVMARTTEAPAMTPARATLVILTRRYLDGLLDPFVTLLELHKLMYFMQASGEALNLQYRKYIYGPYAENLRHVLNTIEGHLVSGYGDGGDVPTKRLELVPGALNDALAYTAGNKETEQRLQRVENLVGGFETPFGLELLATVHWIVCEEGATSEESTIKAVYEWSPRKRRFTERQIALGYTRLREQGWFDRGNT